MKTKKLIVPLVVLLAVGLALGAYVTSLQDSSTIQEPFTVTMTDDLADTIYPGESDTVIITVSNDASVPLYANVYDTINITDSDPDADGYLLEEDDITLNPDGDCLQVPADGSTDFTFTVSIEPDAEPGSFDISFKVERVSGCGE